MSEKYFHPALFILSITEVNDKQRLSLKLSNPWIKIQPHFLLWMHGLCYYQSCPPCIFSPQIKLFFFFCADNFGLRKIRISSVTDWQWKSEFKSVLEKDSVIVETLRWGGELYALMDLIWASVGTEILIYGVGWSLQAPVINERPIK